MILLDYFKDLQDLNENRSILYGYCIIYTKSFREVILKIAKDSKKKTHQTNLCLSGGVALNCVANNVL